MRVKYTCRSCSTQMEVELDNQPSKAVCPHCHTEANVQLPPGANLTNGKSLTHSAQIPRVTLKNTKASNVKSIGLNKATPQDSYQMRWRGRSEGPFTLEEINERLESGQIGLLTEVQIRGEWITLREFFKAAANNAFAIPNETGAEMQYSGVESKSSSGSPPPGLNPPSASRRATKRVYVVSGIAILLITLVASGVYIIAQRSGKTKTIARVSSRSATNGPRPIVIIPPKTNESPIVASATYVNPSATNVLTISPTTNVSTTSNSSELTNAAHQIAVMLKPVVLPPLPENEARTFNLKNQSNYVGSVINVNEKGIIIKQTSGRFTVRLDWELFDQDLIEREPKVIAFRASLVKAREAAEKAKIAAIQAAAKARRDQEEQARAMEQYRAQRDKRIESGIARYGWKTVTSGYLKAWGSKVSIGEIFAVVAPSAIWSAGKLSDLEPERYTHYLVQARWVNKNGENVTMQYLVTIDGSDFNLHGCFVNGTKMADLPFLVAVKDIYIKN